MTTIRQHVHALHDGWILSLIGEGEHWATTGIIETDACIRRTVFACGLGDFTLLLGDRVVSEAWREAALRAAYDNGDGFRDALIETYEANRPSRDRQ